MADVAKLCNPTPYPVKLDWDRGVVIRIAPFGATNLTSQQMDDFRAGKPGSADVKQTLNYHGLFLLDSDRPYDNQALEALRLAYAAKKAQYDAGVRNITDRRAATGIAPNEEALEETLGQMGYTALREKIATLKEQASAFEKVVGSQSERTQRQQLDPRRTVFILDPPREFPSVASMEFFLDRNPEIKARHTAFHAQAAGDEGAPTVPVESVQRFVASGGKGDL